MKSRLPKMILERVDLVDIDQLGVRSWSITARSEVHTSTPFQISRGRVFAGPSPSDNHRSLDSPLARDLRWVPTCSQGQLYEAEEAPRSASAALYPPPLA
jgi:hypothetical protein